MNLNEVIDDISSLRDDRIELCETLRINNTAMSYNEVIQIKAEIAEIDEKINSIDSILNEKGNK